MHFTQRACGAGNGAAERGWNGAERSDCGTIAHTIACEDAPGSEGFRRPRKPTLGLLRILCNRTAPLGLSAKLLAALRLLRRPQRTRVQIRPQM
jgi:hypothetical protein